ncbi:hypothetical protein [Streptomyces sp. NPDC002588]|uniref:hypothetical protein n=1 Tax=Streptomyces sp. NPDC002588 TaxID=3154419 RepID=UPI00331FACB6
MRKLQRAALVAAMAGTLGLVGAGVASADYSDPSTGSGGRECHQTGVTKPSVNNGLINLPNLNLPILGNVSEGSNQGACNNGDDSAAFNVSHADQETDGLLDLIGG